jgi:hypothetical protein
MYGLTVARALALLAALPFAPLIDARLAGTAAAQDENAVWQLLYGPVDPPQVSGHAAIRDPARRCLERSDPGFSATAPTPASTTSWGRLKTLYR